jgi:hypothetical protein
VLLRGGGEAAAGLKEGELFEQRGELAVEVRLVADDQVDVSSRKLPRGRRLVIRVEAAHGAVVPLSGARVGLDGCVLEAGEAAHAP